MLGLYRKSKKIRMALAAYKASAKHVHEKDVGSTASNGTAKIRDLGKAPGTLATVWADIKSMVAMLRDYARGNYRDVSWTSIAKVSAAVLYFVSPIDVIPDLIPGIGFLDDAAVIALCLKSVRKELDHYRDWQKERGRDRTRCAICGEPMPKEAEACTNRECPGS